MSKLASENQGVNSYMIVDWCNQYAYLRFIIVEIGVQSPCGPDAGDQDPEES